MRGSLKRRKNEGQSPIGVDEQDAHCKENADSTPIATDNGHLHITLHFITSASDNSHTHVKTVTENSEGIFPLSINISFLFG
ncbi:hypothetical protein TNCT_56121 [Trichonephila clavata]|uniref:Uncharacterized protein n=1 Tax=Trichonephila clavata TaxID=2740835 RepID=A0A8X6ISA9_TRICU|nr:hypothetical protein TNCT_56121 [Trichonephila clavata]